MRFEAISTVPQYCDSQKAPCSLSTSLDLLTKSGKQANIADGVNGDLGVHPYLPLLFLLSFLPGPALLRLCMSKRRVNQLLFQ